jgi:hypothetical protein
MRKVVSSLAAAALAAGLLIAVAAPADASTPAKTTTFCKAVKNLDVSTLGNPTSEKGASKSLKQLKKLQAAAKGNLKKALAKVVGAYQKVADGASAKDAFANSAFVKAIATFGLAAGKCVISDLPNITLPKLPDIHLPGQ